MNANDFRELALGFDDTEESAHMGAPDFRVGGRIFATLAHEHLGFGNLMLSPELRGNRCQGKSVSGEIGVSSFYWPEISETADTYPRPTHSRPPTYRAIRPRAPSITLSHWKAGPGSTLLVWTW